MKWVHMPQIHTRLRTNGLLSHFIKSQGSGTKQKTLASRKASYQVSGVGTQHSEKKIVSGTWQNKGDKLRPGASYLRPHHRRLFCGTTTMNAGTEREMRKEKACINVWTEQKCRLWNQLRQVNRKHSKQLSKLSVFRSQEIKSKNTKQEWKVSGKYQYSGGILF